MTSLLALDFELGPDLERAIRDAVDASVAFCVLDRRTSPRRRLEELERLGATAVLNIDGRTELSSGTGVDDEIGVVMLTSGSSGEQKAVELTWSALRASAELTQLTLRGATPPVWVPCLPACHIGGLAVILRAVLSDATLHWGDGEDLESAVAHGATHVSVVRRQLARHDVSGFHSVLLGGARPPEALPDHVIATWGMTETGSGVVYDGVALSGVEVVAVNGELCVRTPTLFRSYRTADRPRVLGPDGREDWFPTGDGGDVIKGRVSVRGRMGFVINTGGEKLWPEDLEGFLSPVAGVVDVAVTGVADPEWGERVVALVVSDGSASEDELRAVANDRIGPWALPKEIRFVTAIPRTTNGKIRRDALEYLF